MENEVATKNSQAKADELEDRLINFAVRVIKLSAALPKTPAGKHIDGKSYGPALLPRRITVKPEALKAMPTLSINSASS